MKAFEYNYNLFRYPDEMEVIIKYLQSKGKINVSEKRLEELYRDFSDEEYCASWMSVLSSDNKMNESTLEHFIYWLSKYDL